MPDGSPLLLALDTLVSPAEVVQDVLVRLRGHYRAIAVDGLADVREQDTQGTVLAVHVSEDEDPTMRWHRHVRRSEK
ncbi:hypothetical protein AB0957_25735 [Streptomyces zhihengii]